MVDKGETAVGIVYGGAMLNKHKIAPSRSIAARGEPAVRIVYRGAILKKN